MPQKGRHVRHDERAILFVGTRKGVFVYESDFLREKWKRTGPFVHDQAIPCIAFDHRDGKSVYVASAGGGLHRTRDFGKSWEKVGRGLPSERLSHVAIGHLSEPGTLWVGTATGAIALSRDGGDSFSEVAGFGAIPSRGEWWGRANGAAVTGIVVHSDSPRHLHVAVSIGGVFRTDDGGQTWATCNQGIAPSYPAQYQHGDAHRDIYCLASNPAKPDRLYAVADQGLYRTDDGGKSWRDVIGGLGARAARAVVVSPSRPGTLFTVPLGDLSQGEPMVKGQFVVGRTYDGGEQWDRLEEGLPEHVFTTVNRSAMCIDTLDEEGVYVATTDGHIHVSLDDGQNWQQIVGGLLPVLSIEIVTNQE